MVGPKVIMSRAAPPPFNLPQALSRRTLLLAPLEGDTLGLPRRVKVTTWGVPLAQARCTIVYAGGAPASAEEPALHSAGHGHDIYAARQIHLVAMDKVGMGGTDLNADFQIRRDYPRLVERVADELGVGKLAMLGISNGGPFVMSALTASCGGSGGGGDGSARDGPRASGALAGRVLGGSVVVGVSDVSASGYFSAAHPSGLFEGVRARAGAGRRAATSPGCVEA